MLKNIILYPHGGSGNHGCEALVRSSCAIADSKNVVLCSKNKDEDVKYGVDGLCRIIDQQSTPGAFGRRLAQLRYHILRDSLAFEKLTYANVLAEADKGSVALSFGGDNYCYGKPVYIYIMNRLLRAKGVKTIMWGCSIEPANIDDEMMADLRGYHKIIARESITFNALRERGLDNVVKHSDPAFILNVDKSVKVPKEFQIGNTVGINLSPMALDYSADTDKVMNNYRTLIRHILENSDMSVAFIPHVVWSDNDDRGPLSMLCDEFKVLYPMRVCMIEDDNAERIKGVISQCRFVVAARTHASIAAYSTCVPTLVLGYSVKARGIAQDLFGTYENYVVPVQKLNAEDDLASAFKFIQEHETEIVKTLNDQMPDIKQSAWDMKKYLC